MPLWTDALTADTDPGATLKDRPRPSSGSHPGPGHNADLGVSWNGLNLAPTSPLSQPQRTQRELLFFANDLSLEIIFHSQNKLPRGLPPAAQKGELCSDCFPEGPSPTSTKPQKKTRAHFGFFFYQIGRVDEFWLKRDCSRGAAVTWRLVKWTRNVFLLFFFRNLVAWFFLLESYIFTYLLLN